ncbi:hypothetical protein [Pseudobacteroides cellulosolvens]|uniref:Uncharacterized protein n=1 Tax=Pseudobacteroides cellulosolvens ATCC 35603 = DSM 2933 TaxID=398512 RepID=A0A0L6JXP9_9FIRM|nr:hypothetical protein [Pseudobacteroides cellulosolvens]KNY30534.1 hypothetical protein Bccel_5814 [Pseudobacteroides cellulosolvens ATCC 35603 = DSM 2933]
MKTILKPIFEWLTDGYTLFDNVLYNYITISIVGFIAFSVAWNIVGSLYRNDIISGKTSGSILHWMIRLITFVVLFSFVSIILRVIRFIITVPLWISLTIAGLFIAGIIIFLIIHSKRSNTESVGK